MTAVYISPDDVHDRGLTVVANPPTPAIDHGRLALRCASCSR